MADVLEPVVDISEPVGEALERQSHPAMRRGDPEVRVAPQHELAERRRVSERYVPSLVEGIDDHLPVRINLKRETKTRVEFLEAVEAQFLTDGVEPSQ